MHFQFLQIIKIEGANYMNDFLLKKMGSNGYIVKEKNSDSPYLNNRFQYITKM
jgi:hypothetical protein